MKVGFYQFSPVFGEPQKNLETIAAQLLKCDADLVVLPELAFSGYLFIEKKEVFTLSEAIPGAISNKLKEIAIKKDMAIVTGFAELAGDKVYNSALLVTPEGNINIYRKNHLFHEEKLFFEPGDSGFPVFTVKGVKIGILVCFDHFFPEAARSLALQGAQVICHPSNLVIPQKAQITTRARSIENKIFWILANRTGSEIRGEKKFTYSGLSQISDPEGRIMVQAGEFEEGFFAVDINPELAKNKSITPLCSLFEDRRTDIYLL
ncbi:MAG: acyltransferase [Spirochaetaceae bacterium]|nr:acyltransferase [Spirochaetaceae bacterium]